jgi:hypothetical protein
MEGRTVTEKDILMYWALRFDGYKYKDQHNFDHVQALATFKQTGTWVHLSDLEKQTVFFMLQRYLGKWGGERLAECSPEWKAYRTLFLETYVLPVPTEYRTSDYYRTWQDRFEPNKLELVEIVRQVHQSTEYSE